VSILVDTNVLLRRTQPGHPQYAVAVESVTRLLAGGEPVHYTLQNVAEFWNVLTRPVASNGMDVSTATARVERQLGDRALGDLLPRPRISQNQSKKWPSGAGGRSRPTSVPNPCWGETVRGCGLIPPSGGPRQTRKLLRRLAFRTGHREGKRLTRSALADGTHRNNRGNVTDPGRSRRDPPVGDSPHKREPAAAQEGSAELCQK
jgi:hypothetical protein